MHLLLMLCAVQIQTPTIDPLKYLVGDWKSAESSIGPGGKLLNFTLDGHNHQALDGQFLQIDETIHLPENKTSKNQILISFDATEKLYHAWWFYSGSPKPIEFTGKVDSTVFELQSGKPALRIRYDFSKPGGYKATVELKSNDAWTNITNAVYARVK